MIQVRDLTEASKSFGTLNSILDSDLKKDTVRTPGSHSRNLRRVRQGLDLIRALFVNFISSEYVFLFLLFMFLIMPHHYFFHLDLSILQFLFDKFYYSSFFVVVVVVAFLLDLCITSLTRGNQ